MATLGTLVLALKADTSAFTKGLTDAKEYSFASSQAIVQSLKSIGTQIGKLNFDDFKKSAKSLEIVGGIASGVGVAIAGAVVAIAKETAENVKQMEKLSQSYGVGIDTISGLRVASKLTGVELEQLTIGMGRLARNAAQVAQTGTGPAAAAFAALKITVTDTHGKLLPMNDLLLQVADKFSRMPDSTTKTALAMQLFGRAGAALIPFLNEGRDGLQKMQQLSEQLGLTWSEKDAVAAKQLAESVEILDLKSTAFKENLSKGVIPALDQISTAFIQVDRNGNSLAKTLGESIGQAFKWIAEAIETAGVQLDVWYLKLKKAFSEASASGFVAGNPYSGAFGPALNPAASSQKALGASGAPDAIDAQIAKLWDDYNSFMTRLESSPIVIDQKSGKTGPVPGFGTSDDVIAIGNDLDELTKKTQALLDAGNKQFDKDPLSRLSDALTEQIQKIQVFQRLHPEAIWASLNGQVEKLQALLADVNEQLNVNINTALKMSGDKGIAEMLGGIPTAIPNVSGSTQAQAQQLQLQANLIKDVNERNKEGLQIYLQTRTFEEQRADRLKELNILLENGAIHQQEYNRAIAEMGGNGSVGSGIQAGMQKFVQQWQGWGVAASQGTYQVLGRMQSSFSTFFTQIIEGTKSIGSAFKELGLSILDSMIQAFTQIVAQWLVTQLVMKAINLIFGTDMQSQATQQIATNVTEATSAAGLAAANTLALTSAMYPPPLPEVFAGLSYGLGMSFAGLASAAGGMEVDRDQLVHVHKDEKILPSRIAKGFDSIINTMMPRSGGGGQPALAGGGGGNFGIRDIHVNGAKDPMSTAGAIRTMIRAEVKRMKKDSGY